ncbi:MAG: 50S ribosomal protein L6 [Candidatus Dojkabacteria bacterium]|nr:MAG: 50S ribosomal protein L6 [Candidatus Dojkabacteria bacterium]
MSRIGRLEIKVPDGVTVTVRDGGRFYYKEVEVTGPKGTLTESLRRGVNVVVEDNIVKVTRDNDTKQNKSFHGLYRSLIANMIQGVTEGYSKELTIVGIGYRAELQGNKVVFSLGFSHKIEYEPPQGVTVEINDQTNIKVSGISKQLVGEVAAKIRSFRKPEPYKGKGIRYSDENVRRKSAKSTA